MENTSGINPVGNRVLIKPDSIEEYSGGGIYIPERERERHEASASYAYVVAIGPDCFTHTVTTTDRLIDGAWKPVERSTVGYAGSWAKPGDRIAFTPYVARDSVGQDGEKYALINDEDILANVTENVTQTSIEARKPLGIK